MANTIFSDLQFTAAFIVASTEDLDHPLQINPQQCKLLAKKVYGLLNTLRRFEDHLGQESFSSTQLAAKELYRVIKDAKNLVTDCCNDRWLKVIINRGIMREVFEGLVYKMQFYSSLLISTFMITDGKSGIIFEKTLCDGELDAAESSSLSEAAKSDKDQIRVLLQQLKGDHNCGEICNIQDLDTQQCLAARYLDKLDGEEILLAGGNNLSESNPFFNVDPRHFTRESRFLGKGSFATVKEKEWMGEKYAVKKFTGQSAVPDFKKEIAALAGLNHPNIVQVVGCFKKDNSVGIIMELMYKSLNDLLKDHKTTPFTIIQAVDLMLQIAEGVKYIHEKKSVHDMGLVHYDLKSLNILLQFADIDHMTPFTEEMDISNTSFVAKLADFGLATIKNASTNYSHQTPNKGSSSWMAPELFKEKPLPTRVQPMKLDVYSFGIVCYEILSGKQPYEDLSKLKRRVKNGERPTIPSGTPVKLDCLIKECWSDDPRKRPNFSTICQELRYIKGLLIRGDISILGQKEKLQASSYLINVQMFSSYIRSTGQILLGTFHVKKTNGEKHDTSPRHLSQLLKSGDQNYKNGNYEEALSDIDAAYNLEPNNAHTLQLRGVVKKKLNDFKGALHDFDRANEVDNNNCFIKVQRGEVKRRLGDVEGALTDLDMANALAPDHYVVLAQRGAVKQELGRFVDALEDLDKARELNPNDAFTYQQIGVVMYELKDLECALHNYDRALELMPRDSCTLRFRGVTRREMLDLQGSLEDFNMVCSNEPTCAFTLKQRGETRRLLCQYKDALEDLNHANEIEANDVFTLSVRGAVYKELKLYENALKDLNEADELDNSNCFIKIQRGEVKRKLENYEEALIDLDKANVLAPYHSIILAQRGVVRLKMMEFVKALEDLNQAHALNCNDWFVFQQRGVVRFKLNDFEGALSDLNMANELMPQDTYTLLHRGMIRRKLKDFIGALADFDEAYDIEPQCASLLNHRAEIKCILKRHEDALDDLDRADLLQPNTVFTLWTRGIVYKELKLFEKALKDLNKANELDSQHEFVKIQRGVVKQSLRDFEGALVDLNEANTLKPNQAFVLAQLGKVKRELRKCDEALKDLDRAHELDPNDAFVYQQRGVVKRELGDLEGALDDLNKAYVLKPEDSYTLRRRGVTKRELMDYIGSLDDLNNANVIESYNDLTLSERGVTKKVLGDYRGALEDLTMSHYITSNQPFTLKHRGSANRELGNLENALQDLTSAYHLEPSDVFTLVELGMTKKLNHDHEGSLKAYDKAVEMEPVDPFILRQRGSLRRLCKDHAGALDDLIKADKVMQKVDNNTLETVMERCFSKYAMKDVTGALEDAKKARTLSGVYDRFSIKGESLKLATTCQSTRSIRDGSSLSRRVTNIKAESSPSILWIDHRKMLFIKDLGRGSYGYVRKCKWVGKKKEVAVKYVSSHIKDAFEYEVWMLAKIQHPRVVRLIGCSYDDEEKQGLLVMELMQSNLRSLIDSKKREYGAPFDLPVAVDIMAKIAEAMEYVHDQGVLHRDLKSSNILVNKIEDGNEEYVVKIADFGMANWQGKNNMPYFMSVDVGATLWRAPEVFKNGECIQKYSYPADVWSYGITCFEILSGEVPFEGVECARIRKRVIGGLRPELPASCSDVLKSLLMKCWSHMPYDRPTFANIHKILILYLGTITSRDCRGHRAGDAIQLHGCRRHSV